MESRVAINTLFDRLGPFTLDPAVEPHIELAFRSPLSLPVVFQARVMPSPCRARRRPSRPPTTTLSGR